MLSERHSGRISHGMLERRTNEGKERTATTADTANRLLCYRLSLAEVLLASLKAGGRVQRRVVGSEIERKERPG
jgi:hypothetical protein